MSWKDLLQTGNEALVTPWLGGRSIRSGPREWAIDGRLPREVGWYTFKLTGRKATLQGPADPQTDLLAHVVKGYLVGDRVIPDNVQVTPDPARVAECSEPVALLDRGLDRFVRISAGRTHEGGPLVYKSQEFPFGAEDAVTRAFLRKVASVGDIPNVPPALDAAFRVETWARVEAERRRAELERQKAEEEARRLAEERRGQLARQLGTGEGRRAMASIDFRQAATAALQVGGAEYLDHKVGYRNGEAVVTFRMLNRHFACVCDEKTMRIIEAGICLVDHRTNERGDTKFTLESLPAVIREAHRTGVLVVTRHTGLDDPDDYEDD